jgi:hypothetical protein
MDDELELIPPVGDPWPTITASDRLAAEIIEAIDAIAARIPCLEGPHPMTAPSVRSGRTVPKAAIISMIAAVEDQPQLQQLETFNIDYARETLQFNEAFRHVIDRLNALTASVSFTMEARKANVAFELLRTYGVMKAIARDPGSAGMFSHVQNVRRDLGRKSGPAPEPSPSTEPER